jgi:predicted nucleic acid-binding Zn ribbon protein
MRRRFSQKKPEPLGQILQKALKRRKVPIDLEKERILSLWGKAVGPQIAAQTRPSHIKGKTLFVGVSSSVWMHQLHFLKCDLIRQFNLFAQKEAVEKFSSLWPRSPRP